MTMEKRNECCQRSYRRINSIEFILSLSLSVLLMSVLLVGCESSYACERDR